MIRTANRRRTAAALSAVALVTTGATVAVLTASGASAAPACSVNYRVDQWSGGFVANIELTAGDTALNGWDVTWTYAGDQRITSFWNAQVTQSTPPGGVVSARSMAWNGSVPAGGRTQFGVQGTFSSANPAPTDFAVNGVACGGATPTTAPTIAPTTGATTPPTTTRPTTPSTTTRPTTPPTTTRPTTPPTTTRPTTPPTTQPPTGCGSAVICDGFENQTGTTPSGDWSVVFPDCSGTGSAAIDTAVSRSGGRSLRINGTAGYCNHIFVRSNRDLSGIGAAWYGRFYVRHTTPLPAAHVTFLAMRDANDGNRDLRMGGQTGALQWNRTSDDATLPEQSPNGVALSRPLPTNTWSCVEFKVDGATRTMQTWLDGSIIPGLTVDGTPTQDLDGQWLRNANWRPSLTDFKIGWESYGDGADTLWYDDVALGSNRIGC